MVAISPEQLQQAVQQAVATAAQQRQEAAAQMHQEIGNLCTQVQDALAVPLPREATTSQRTIVLRRRRRLEGLERCLQKLCVCMLCAAGHALGTNGEISCTGAQRDADAD